MGQLYPETEIPSQGSEKEKEVTCLNVREETKLPLLACCDYRLENQYCLNTACPFPKKKKSCPTQFQVINDLNMKRQIKNKNT